MRESNRFWQMAWAALGLLVITSPFIWFELRDDYSHGTIQALWNGQKGSRFFLNLVPAFLIAAGIWLIRRTHHRFGWPHVGPFLKRAVEDKKAIVVCWFACFTLAFFLNNSGLSTAIFVGIWMIQALGLNIAIGMTGLLVLGYAGFYAMGGYAFAIANKYYPFVTWWMALPLATAAGGLAGWVVGLPCLRLRGDYLAIVTLGFGECFRELVRNWGNVTGGDQGLIISANSKIPPIAFLNPNQTTYLTVALFLILSIAFCDRLYHSWVGRAWVAIREDETAASSMGIPVVKMKLLAFVVSAAFGSIAGVLYVGYTGFIDPASCAFENSVMVLAMVILGGLGSIRGVLLGSALLYLIPTLMRNYFPAIADYRLFFFGIIMVVIMLLRPQGLLGSRRHELEIQAK